MQCLTGRNGYKFGFFKIIKNRFMFLNNFTPLITYHDLLKADYMIDWQRGHHKPYVRWIMNNDQKYEGIFIWSCSDQDQFSGV